MDCISYNNEFYHSIKNETMSNVVWDIFPNKFLRRKRKNRLVFANEEKFQLIFWQKRITESEKDRNQKVKKKTRKKERMEK